MDLVTHDNFEKNGCARINNKKRNHALSEGHFKHIQITQLAQQSTVISSVSKSQTFKYSGYQYHEQLSIMISAHLIAVNASV